MPDTDMHQKRQGWWLRVARERAGLKQEAVAKAVGLSQASKSTISDYERGITLVPQDTLLKLALLYGVPARIFQEPDLSGEEQIEERMAEIAREATRRAVSDTRRAAARGQAVDAQPSSPRRRQSR